MYFGQLFLSQTECYFAILVGSQSEQWWERAPVKSERYGPSVCPWAKHSASSDWQGWLLIICLSWLPSEEKMQRCSLTLEGHWSQEQLLSTGERLRSPSRFLSLCLPLHSAEDRQRWGILSVFCPEKWKFESERWSEASKGTCNWAALDRLSGNMKQQQLWRRVIASLGLYNALSSL